MWQVRCSAGFQPPATARQSAAMWCSLPPCRTRTSRSPSRPRVPTTAPPANPRHGPAGSATSRASTSAVTSTPAATRSAAVRQPSSQVENTTARRGATAQRWRYARTAPASITPGRSFAGNATGRSSAPAARIARFAAIRQKHWTGTPSGRSPTCSATRSSAPYVPPS